MKLKLYNQVYFLLVSHFWDKSKTISLDSYFLIPYNKEQVDISVLNSNINKYNSSLLYKNNFKLILIDLFDDELNSGYHYFNYLGVKPNILSFNDVELVSSSFKINNHTLRKNYLIIKLSFTKKNYT